MGFEIIDDGRDCCIFCLVNACPCCSSAGEPETDSNKKTDFPMIWQAVAVV